MSAMTAAAGRFVAHAAAKMTTKMTTRREKELLLLLHETSRIFRHSRSRRESLRTVTRGVRELETVLFEIAAVISQPGRPRGRGRKSSGPPPPSPVTQSAIDRGVDEAKLLNPAKANEPEFLETLAKMNLDLCVTAAYGNFLPQKISRYSKIGDVEHSSFAVAAVQRCGACAEVHRERVRGNRSDRSVLRFLRWTPVRF